MPNTVEYYLSKGFDRPMAEYFAGGRKKLVAVAPQQDFTLLLTYENGEKRVLDVNPILDKGGVFTPFRDYENFKRVYVDNCNCIAWDIDPNVDSNIVWNNKVDLCPDCCYVDSVPINYGGESAEETKVTPQTKVKNKYNAKAYDGIALQVKNGEEWDPDFTKTTEQERKDIEAAEQSGFVDESNIDWNNLSSFA